MKLYMEPDNPTRTCVPYERLDYMHVPTYAPLFCLLLRAELLLIFFEIVPQSLNLLCAFYFFIVDSSNESDILLQQLREAQAAQKRL